MFKHHLTHAHLLFRIAVIPHNFEREKDLLNEEDLWCHLVDVMQLEHDFGAVGTFG